MQNMLSEHIWDEFVSSMIYCKVCDEKRSQGHIFDKHVRKVMTMNYCLGAQSMCENSGSMEVVAALNGKNSRYEQDTSSNEGPSSTRA